MVINFIVPMVGNSSRFFKDGYTKPKYELMLGERSLFERVLNGLDESTSEKKMFHFGVRNDFAGGEFVEKSLESYNIDFTITEFEGVTCGQASTVHKILENSAIKSNIYIFNIDCILVNYDLSNFGKGDGGLDLFQIEGDHWSFARLDSQGGVVETAEKKRISSYASTGLYFFKTTDIYQECYNSIKKHNSATEMYVAPMYNSLIKKSCNVRSRTIQNNQIILVGTPAEYQRALKLF